MPCSLLIENKHVLVCDANCLGKYWEGILAYICFVYVYTSFGFESFLCVSVIIFLLPSPHSHSHACSHIYLLWKQAQSSGANQ